MSVPKLRLPQARVLRALLPANVSDPQCEWPLLTRATLGVRAGYSAISGSVTRALNGIHPGSSSGDPHPGILTLGLCEVVTVYIEEGISEESYRITEGGVKALRQFVMDGGRLPPVKDASVHTNNRYREK